MPEGTDAVESPVSPLDCVAVSALAMASCCFMASSYNVCCFADWISMKVSIILWLPLMCLLEQLSTQDIYNATKYSSSNNI